MEHRHSFPRSRRVRSRHDYSTIFDARVREARGPLVLYGAPSSLGFCRFGLSTPRRVGNAVRRNRIRRLLREAFRRMRNDLTGSYDLVVVVLPHEPLKLEQYDELLKALVDRIDVLWKRKLRSSEATEPVTGTSPP